MKNNKIVCVVCGLPFQSGSIQIGMGDGTGQKFAHEHCYYRELVKEKDREIDDLKKKIKYLTGTW